MSLEQKSELERERDELALKRVSGTTTNIEINERSLTETRAKYAKKGMSVSKEDDYDQESYHLVKRLKEFDALVDPSKGIKKVVESMTRQPVTIFNKNGKAEVKDALYFRGWYYGQDKVGNDLGAEFTEGFYKVPRLIFTSIDPNNPFDSKTGERRGTYRPSGISYGHYIYLPDKKEDRVKFLEESIGNAPGTSISNLSQGGHLTYRNPSPNNGHSGTHGGGYTWKVFCELSLEELGELQQKNYYTEKETGQIKDKTGQRVGYDPSTGKVESARGR